MKYRNRKTNEIVDVVGYSACTHTRYPSTDYVCYIDNKGEEIVGRGLNLIWDFEPISENYDFDWQSFRNQTAKDILCHTLSGGLASGATGILEKTELLVEGSIELADELIKQLKEKEN